MSFDEEFRTVNLILESGAETLGVDAFALSLIKAERQARRIFSFLVYQSEAFGNLDIEDLKYTLADDKKVYFNGVITGIDNLSPISVRDLVGPDYSDLIKKIGEATKHRNKIFHGQLTGKNLTRADLLDLVEQIKKWCKFFSIGAKENFGYDGFERNSFRKSSNQIKLKWNIRDLAEYKIFITEYMNR